MAKATSTTISRRTAIKGAAAIAATAAIPITANASPHDDDTALARLWDRRNRLVDAAEVAENAAHKVRMSLPEDIRRGQRLTVTTLSGKTGECSTEPDIQRLYNGEFSRHPKSKMEAWSDELVAAYRRCEQIDHANRSEDDLKAGREYHCLQSDHDRSISTEISHHRNEALARLEREQARCANAREHAGLPALDAKEEALDSQAWEIERQITETEVRGVAGLAIQAKLLRLYMEAGEIIDGRDLRLADNMLVSLERLSGGAS